jgi:hypothetical protein
MTMATFRRGPDPGAQFAAGIAQGAANFVTSYQTAQKNQAENQMRQAELELKRQAIMIEQEKFKKEFEPIAVDLRQIQLLKQASSQGFLDSGTASSLIKKKTERVLENANSPGKIAALQGLLGREAQMQARIDQRMQERAQVRAESQSPSRAIGQPEPQGDPQASADPYVIHVNPKVLDYASKLQGYENQAQLAGLRAQTSVDVANIQAQSREQLEDLKARVDQQLKAMDLDKAGADRASRERMNKETNAARIEAAKLRAKNQSQAKVDPVTLETAKTLLRTIQPPSGINFNSPKKIAEAKASLAELIRANPVLKNSIPNIERVLGVQPQAAPSMPNPAPQAAQPKPQPSALPIVWDLKGPKPKVKAGDVVQTPRGNFKVVDDNGTIEPVK